MGEFAVVVRRWLDERGLSVRAAARLAGYSDHTLLSKVLNGRRPVTPYLALRLDQALEAGGEVIDAAGAVLAGSSGVPAVPGDGIVRESAADAVALVTRAGLGRVDPVVLDQAWDDTAQLLGRYSLAPGADGSVLRDATVLRRRVQALAGAYQTAAQLADVYLLLGMLSGVASYVSLDLGYPAAAMTQARAAWLMGELSGHDGLRAWSAGTQALIARFAEDYPAALAAVARGLPYATSGTSRVRLLCGQGQTLAHMEDSDEAVRALDAAWEARDRASGPDVAEGGLFTFSLAKQHYYSGSSLQWLSGRHAKAAADESAEAIRLFRVSDPAVTSVADELLAHVYLGNARLTMDEPEGTMEALRPVLGLPPGQRSAWHRKRMAQIAGRLSQGSVAGSRLAAGAREEIAAFTCTAP